MSAAPTKAERVHMARIKSMPCGLCGDTNMSSAHHIRTGQGMGQKASDWLTIPLCYTCHQSPVGIHGDKSMWKVMGKTELDVLAETIARLIGQ